MNRILRVIMALLMIIAIYCTFRFRMVPASTKTNEIGKTIVIDPGHGGEDPGKVGVNDLLEKDVNLAIAKQLQMDLEAQGYRVVLTRTKDEGLHNTDAKNKKVSDMSNRCSLIERENAELVISIHQNSFSQESVRGAQVFYYKYSSEGKQLAECIQQAIRENVDSNNQRVVKDNSSYYMLVHTPCPTVIVECGFLSNREEAEKLGTNEYQKKIADAICQGIMSYDRKGH